jgi:hypothetical protein
MAVTDPYPHYLPQQQDADHVHLESSGFLPVERLDITDEFGATAPNESGLWLAGFAPDTDDRPHWKAVSDLGYYGAWQSQDDHTAADTTTAYAITLDTIDYENGFSIIDTTKITAANAGIYNLQWSGQFQNIAAADHDVHVWIRKNGVDVVGSTGFISVPAKHGTIPGHTIAGWNYVIELAAGDYLEFWWHTDNADVTIQYYGGGVTPTFPSTASMIVTIVPVVMIGVGGGGGECVCDPGTINASDLATIFVPVFVAETGQVILDENGYPVMAEIANP